MEAITVIRDLGPACNSDLIRLAGGGCEMIPEYVHLVEIDEKSYAEYRDKLDMCVGLKGKVNGKYCMIKAGDSISPGKNFVVFGLEGMGRNRMIHIPNSPSSARRCPPPPGFEALAPSVTDRNKIRERIKDLEFELARLRLLVKQ